MDNQVATALQSLEAQLNEHVVQLQGLRPIWEQDTADLFNEVSAVVLIDSDHESTFNQAEQRWVTSLANFKTSAEKVQQQVESFIQNFDGELKDTRSILEQRLNDWQDQAESQFNIILENITGHISQIGSDWTEKNEYLKSFVTDLEERLMSGKEMLETQWNASIENIEDRQTAHFEELFNQHKNVIESYSTNLLQQVISDESNFIETSLNDFAVQGTQAAESMEKMVTGLMQNLQKQVGDNVTSTIEDMMRQFIEDVMVKLATEVQEALVTTSVGASTTATLSPILPELKAIKLATDAILDAIEVWKKLKELGGF